MKEKIIRKLIVQFKDGGCYKGNVKSLEKAKERNMHFDKGKILSSEWYDEKGEKTIIVKEKKEKVKKEKVSKKLAKKK